MLQMDTDLVSHQVSDLEFKSSLSVDGCLDVLICYYFASVLNQVRVKCDIIKNYSNYTDDMKHKSLRGFLL